MERRAGVFAVQMAFALVIAAVWAWALTAWPLFDYWVLPSLLPTYGLLGLAASIGLWLVVRQRTGAQLATFIVGIIVIGAGVGLGLAPPIFSSGQSGWCKTVFGNHGLHGDDREDCFDARAARADDVAVILTVGLLTSAVGSTLLVRETGRRDQVQPAGSPTGPTGHAPARFNACDMT
ncbi:MAG: hypothetical protein ACRDZ8_06355 [Acidimicrobiales bacterium]